MRNCALAVSCLLALAQSQDENVLLRRRELGEAMQWGVSESAGTAEEDTAVDVRENILERTYEEEYSEGKGYSSKSFKSDCADGSFKGEGKGSTSSKSSKGCDDDDISTTAPHPPPPHAEPKPPPQLKPKPPPQCGQPGLGQCGGNAQCVCKCVPDNPLETKPSRYPKPTPPETARLSELTSDPIENARLCSSHPACVEVDLVSGNCCPNDSNWMLECCGPTM